MMISNKVKITQHNTHFTELTFITSFSFHFRINLRYSFCGLYLLKNTDNVWNTFENCLNSA